MKINKIKELRTASPEESEFFGRKLAGILQNGDVISFTGDLGTGKTHIIRNMGYKLGIPSEVYVTSPTYTLINEYPLENFTFYHIDLYRLGNEDEIWETGFFDIINSQENIAAVEWWNLFPDTIPETVLQINIKDTGSLSRIIEIYGNDSWQKRFENFDF